jgi:K+-sensing histidine kinase KdpD
MYRQEQNNGNFSDQTQLASGDQHNSPLTEIADPDQLMERVRSEILAGAAPAGLQIVCTPPHKDIILIHHVESIYKALFFLLENCVQRSSSRQTVECSCLIENDMLVFDLLDEGQPITNQQGHPLSLDNVGKDHLRNDSTLFTVLEYIPHFGGSLAIESTLHSGTCCSLTIPLSKVTSSKDL